MRGLPARAIGRAPFLIRFSPITLLCFEWWEPVYYKAYDEGFPSDSREERGRFVGVAENVGNVMTFKILTDDTKRGVVYHSNVRSARKEGSSNIRIDPIDGEMVEQVVKLLSEEQGNASSGKAGMESHLEKPAPDLFDFSYCNHGSEAAGTTDLCHYYAVLTKMRCNTTLPVSTLPTCLGQ